MITVQELLQNTYEMVSKGVKLNRSTMPLLCWVDGADENFTAIIPDFARHKEEYVQAILPGLLQEKGARAYVLVAEAWLLRGDLRKDDLSVRPSQSDRREEVLKFTAADIEGNYAAWIYNIIRAENGEVTGITLLMKMEPSELTLLSGRLFKFLEKNEEPGFNA